MMVGNKDSALEKGLDSIYSTSLETAASIKDSKRANKRKKLAPGKPEDVQG